MGKSPEKHKILFCADIHGSKSALKILKKKSENVDLIVCAGDFTNFEEHMHSILKKFDSFKKKVLVIHGNHEFKEDLEEVCKKSKNLIFIHEKFYKFHNIVFYGYGGGGFQLKEQLLNELIPEIKNKFKEYNSKNKNIIKIIVFHGPPYGTMLDIVEYGAHVGSKTKMKLVNKVKPNIVIAGHIHETNYQRETKGKTFFLNPGPKGRIIKFNK